METEELIKLVDGIYKNILDKFNPGARQMINAGKAYLKALHGAAAASRLYVDAISKLARQAQQGTWGGCSDIGVALMKVVEVYKQIHDQQMNILKAFYVDLLVPLETNLEKDTKVVQSEQKRFLQQHKQRSETYSKAAATIKKQRKKSKGTTKGGLAMDKELKNMQVLEEEKTKLDAFYEQSLKNAMTQERRRYGFVLERHCSLTKHYISYHTQGVASYQQNLDKWSEVAKTREYLPESVESIFSTRIRQVSIWQDDDLYADPRSSRYDDDRISINSQLRKTKSMDASCLDVRSIQDISSPVTTLSRAKSEFNINTSTASLVQDLNTPPRSRPKSMAVPPVPPPQWETQLARALYAYLSSGDNQLSFLEGDVIALIGERNKGWQFGENLRTQSTGWFPLAYTEILDDSTLFSSPKVSGVNHHSNLASTPSTGTLTPLSPSGSSANANLETPSPRMFGDTLHLHRSSANAKQIRRAIASNNIPPPALPAPIPTPSLPYHKTGITQSQSTNFNNSKPEMDMSTFQTPGGIRTSTSSYSFTKPPTLNPLPIHLQTKGGKIGGPVGNVSLHSSNDSGFSNDPPPQPEIDYSDDESLHTQSKMSTSRQSRPQTNKNVITRPSVASSNLGFSDDQSIILKEDRKGFVKRTKSFWKFGKNGSDNEVLEGMALWKHRDLVDVNKERNRRKIERTRKASSDSEKTINANQFDTNIALEVETTTQPVVQDEFYDHEDGLLMRTVNRREILQQYNGDTTGSDTDSDNEVKPPEDPYDCIVVKDQSQKVRKSGERSNVAAIGKKLEKLSKSSKFSPDKEQQNSIELKNEKNKTNIIDNNNVIRYSERDERSYSFKTFKTDPPSNEDNTKREMKDNNKTRSNRRFYNDDNNSHIRSSYESINSETTTKQSNYDERIRDNSADDEFSDAVENRQFLPRTKLTKTNSNGSSKKQDNGNSYNDTIKKKQERSSRSSRNTYGPWYDLWGLDASVRK